eukprot:COSAG01_NODE_20315_length_960_cov_0.852497_2_plen_62_part_01
MLSLPGIERKRVQRRLHEVGMGMRFSVFTCSHKREGDKSHKFSSGSKTNLEIGCRKNSQSAH